MASLHRKWSNRVHIPTGTHWTPSGSVAECLNWNPNRNAQGIPQVTFNPNHLELTETTKFSNTVEHSRAVTPCGNRVYTPKPPTARNAWSNYRVDGDQVALDTLANRTYSPQPPDVFRDTLMQSQRPGSKYGMYDNTSKAYDVYQEASDAYRNQSRTGYDPDKEELIRDFLTRKEIESYEREIGNERQKLHDETQRAYEDHVQTMLMRSEAAAAYDPLKTHLTQTALDPYYDGRLAGKPPIPQPPTYGQTHYPKTPHPRKFHPLQSHRASRPPTTSGDYGQACTRNMDDMLTTKRVMFQSPRPGSAAAATNRDGRNYYHTKKGEHFSQWRDAVAPAVKPPTHYGGVDQPWKMNRFIKSAQPRISTRWDANSRVGSAHRRENTADTGKVNVNVQCAEGDKMDVELSICRSPSKVF